MQHVALGGLTELSGFMDKMESRMEKQQTLLIERDEKAKQDAKAERAEMDAKMESQRAEMEARLEKQQAAMEAKVAELTPAPPQEAVSAEQLTTLQARLETIHQAKLLTEEELFALEDLCADYVELKTISAGVMTKEMALASPALEAAATLYKLVGVSEQVAGDAAFARQARRKFVAK